MAPRAAQTYRRVYLESASPARILDELFARLIADIDEATAHIQARDAGQKGVVLNHGLAIVEELALALDVERAPELCQRLRDLYQFVADQLVQANLRFEAAPLPGARRVVVTLREAFLDAARAPAPTGARP